MIVTRTFLDKANTIIKDNPVNTGLNPVLELNYGKLLTRGLIHFDCSDIACKVADKVYPDPGKLHHVLHMTNAASFDMDNMTRELPATDYNSVKERATSFDIILFLIPEDWDSGRGFDYVTDLFYTNRRAVSDKGSSWYFSRTNYPWKTKQEGIYSLDFLSKELDKFTAKCGNRSDVIIAYEHFDYGNENIEIDITETVNKFISGELPNYGLGIAFSPRYEATEGLEKTQYVGFFTQHTHSFFEPYVETRYDDYIKDDRNDFILDRENHLYFYANLGGNFVNLDRLPKCEVGDTEYPVEQVTQGVYRARVTVSSDDYDPDTMLYDVWSEIQYNGRNIPDVEMEFVTKPSDSYFAFGSLPKNSSHRFNQDYVPTLYGVNDREKILRGNILKLNVECKVPYTTDVVADTDGVDYRLYVDMGDRQIDVISWTSVEQDTNGSYFLLDTKSLIPYRYSVDMRVRKGGTVNIHPRLATFDIVSDVTDEKH